MGRPRRRPIFYLPSGRTLRVLKSWCRSSRSLCHVLMHKCRNESDGDRTERAGWNLTTTSISLSKQKQQITAQCFSFPNHKRRARELNILNPYSNCSPTSRTRLTAFSRQASLPQIHPQCGFPWFLFCIMQQTFTASPAVNLRDR